MDLNYLYHRHHVSLFMAEFAASERVSRVHYDFAARYAGRIADAKLARLPACAA
jgi:hypothetical protein